MGIFTIIVLSFLFTPQSRPYIFKYYSGFLETSQDKYFVKIFVTYHYYKEIEVFMYPENEKNCLAITGCSVHNKKDWQKLKFLGDHSILKFNNPKKSDRFQVYSFEHLIIGWTPAPQTRKIKNLSPYTHRALEFAVKELSQAVEEIMQAKYLKTIDYFKATKEGELKFKKFKIPLKV